MLKSLAREKKKQFGLGHSEERSWIPYSEDKEEMAGYMPAVEQPFGAVR